MRDGKGALTTINGRLYVGDFLMDRLTGFAKIDFYDIEEGLTFEGELLDSFPHGKGKLMHPSGKLYVGEFYNGKRTGKGQLVFPDGSCYEGDFLND